MTNDLIADRIKWLQEEQAKAAALPDKEESTVVTRDLIADKLKWLHEQQAKAAELPEKQQLEITNELISARMNWLEKGSDLNAPL